MEVKQGKTCVCFRQNGSDLNEQFSTMQPATRRELNAIQIKLCRTLQTLSMRRVSALYILKCAK